MHSRSVIRLHFVHVFAIRRLTSTIFRGILIQTLLMCGFQDKVECIVIPSSFCSLTVSIATPFRCKSRWVELFINVLCFEAVVSIIHVVYAWLIIML